MYEKPSYQRDLSHRFPTILGSSVKASGRLTPDVSFNAAIAGGVLAYAGFLGRWVVFGGTSASSPAWAAIIAILNQKNGAPVGFVNPAIYRLAASGKYTDAFHDITHGENSDSAGQAYVCGLDAQNNPIFCPPADGFAAGPRYDLTTGWGTPDVAHFIQDIGTFLHGENGGGD
jgi:subtilase family serine protease